MSEFYRDATDAEVSLNVAGANVTSAVFKRGGEEVATASSSPAPLPYSITHEDGDFAVEWTYEVDGDEYKRVDRHTIVTPFFSRDDLVEADPSFTALSENKVKSLERMVRHVIQKYTGQTFGYRKGSVTAVGKGWNTLDVPERVISVESVGYEQVGTVSPITFNRAWHVTGDGFTIHALTGYVGDSIKVPAYEELVNESGVIFDPYAAPRQTFHSRTLYKVNGEFGWPSIPEDVRTAALTLAGEFSCNQAAWRDRYISSIRSADWGYEFNSAAFAGTGSVSADQLLSGYIVNRLGMI